MARELKEDHPIPWVCDEDQQDFYAVIGDYKLRVEQMGTRHWWWRVYYHDTAIPTMLNEFASCRREAISLAEGVFLGHQAAQFELLAVKNRFSLVCAR